MAVMLVLVLTGRLLVLIQACKQAVNDVRIEPSQEFILNMLFWAWDTGGCAVCSK
jgi:hypothetical protein